MRFDWISSISLNALGVTVSILLTLSSRVTLAGTFNGGGGGNGTALEFYQAAQRAVKQLWRIPALSDLEVDKINETMAHARIIVENRDLYIDSSEGWQLVAALNYPDMKVIRVSEPGWRHLDSRIRREALALHEILSLMGIERTGKYQYSQAYYESMKSRQQAASIDLLKQQTLNEPVNPFITIVVYEDLSSRGTGLDESQIQKIILNFGDRVKVVMRNLSLENSRTGAASMFTALSGICINEQGLLKTFRSKIIQMTVDKRRADDTFKATKSDVESVIHSIERIDRKAMNRCLSSPAAQAQLEADLRNAKEMHLNVNGTMTISSTYESIVWNELRSKEKPYDIVERLLNARSWTGGVEDQITE